MQRASFAKIGHREFPYSAERIPRDNGETMTHAAMKAQTLREQNSSLVLRTIAQSAEPPSRAAVAARTGLTKATVSRLVEDLMSRHIIRELEPTYASAGRPSLPLALTQLAYLSIGIEININYIAIVVLDLSGARVLSAVTRTSNRNSEPATVFAAVQKLLDQWEKPAGAHVICVSLCLPGLVDEHTNHLLTAPNLGWTDLAPLDYLSIPFPEAQFCVLNEADASAFASLYTSPGRATKNHTFLYLSGEVGIGSAIMINGSIFKGKHGWAGEIGHICIDPTGPQCTCGANGCLEQYLGQDALLRRAHIPLEETIETFIERFLAGDDDVRAALDTASVSLGRGIANVFNLLDLDLVILGGNLGLLLPHFEHILHAELKYRTLSSRWNTISVITDERGVLASATGACFAAFEHFFRNPYASMTAS